MPITYLGTVQHRRGLTSEIQNTIIIPAIGELCVEYDDDVPTKLLSVRIGNGTDSFYDLPNVYNLSDESTDRWLFKSTFSIDVDGIFTFDQASSEMVKDGSIYQIQEQVVGGVQLADPATGDKRIDTIVGDRTTGFYVIVQGTPTTGTPTKPSIGATQLAFISVTIDNTTGTPNYTYPQSTSASIATKQQVIDILAAGDPNADPYALAEVRLINLRHLFDNISGFTTGSYAEIKDLADSGLLTPNTLYQITDYTCIRYDDVQVGDISGLATENLVLKAITTTTFAREVLSLEYPNDLIIYDITRATTLTISGPMKGLITYRYDTLNDVSAFYDWRNARYGVNKLTVDINTIAWSATFFDATGEAKLINHGSGYEEYHVRITAATHDATPNVTTPDRTVELIKEDGTSFAANEISGYAGSVNGYCRMVYDPNIGKFLLILCPQINDIITNTHNVPLTSGQVSSIGLSRIKLNVTGAVSFVNTFQSGTPRGVHIGRPTGSQRYNYITFAAAPSGLTIKDQSYKMVFLGNSVQDVTIGEESRNCIIRGQFRYMHIGNEFQYNLIWNTTNSGRMTFGTYGGDQIFYGNVIFAVGDIYSFNFDQMQTTSMYLRTTSNTTRNSNFQVIENCVFNWTLLTTNGYNTFGHLFNKVFLPSATFYQSVWMKPTLVNELISLPQIGQNVDSVVRQTVTITVSAAEMLAINTTPKVLVAKQGVGTYLIFHKLFVKQTYVAATYAGDTDVFVALDSNALVLSQFVNISSASSQTFMADSATLAQDNNSADNVDLILTTASTDPTTGDGTFEVVVEYSVIKL